MHAVQLLDSLALLRSDRTLCDVFLQAQDGEATNEAEKEVHGVWAHRAVLAAASPYFLAMFTKFAERTESIVTIKNVEPAALQAVVEYIYSPESLSVTVTNAHALLSTASVLAVDGIRDVVCSFLEHELTPDNVLGIRAIAEQYACDALTTAVARFISNHSKLVLQADELLALSTNALEALLDSITVNAEEYVLDAVLRWTQHLQQERQQQLDDLLQHVRLPMVPQKVLLERVHTEPLKSAGSHVKSLVTKALAFHSKKPGHRLKDIAGSVWYRPRQPRTSALLVMGGWTGPSSTSDMLLYDLSTNRWQPVGSLPAPRDSAGVAVINNRVYIVGGEDDGRRLKSTVVYDVGTGSWMTGPKLRTTRGRLGVAALDGMLYAAGGWNTAGKILSSAEALDPREGIWRNITNMSVGRRGFGFAALNGFLYAAGGHNNTVERYEPVIKRWEPVEPMAQRRWNVGAGVMDDTLYVVGGHDGSTLSSVERYCTESGWESVPSMSTSRAGAAVAAHAGRLYVVGGRKSHRERFSSVAVFDPATNVWGELPAAMPAGRSFSTAVVLEWTQLVT